MKEFKDQYLIYATDINSIIYLVDSHMKYICIIWLKFTGEGYGPTLCHTTLHQSLTMEQSLSYDSAQVVEVNIFICERGGEEVVKIIGLFSVAE